LRFARRYDFKRAFEESASAESQIAAAFYLTQAAAMLIKCDPNDRQNRAYFDSNNTDSRNEAHRRGWVIPLARLAVRGPGALEPLFYYPNFQA
jgi:hypothetical protein